MSAGTADKAAPAYSGARPLLIFCVFVLGAVLARFAEEETVFLDSLLPSVAVYALAFGVVLTLSASVLGIALLPICALCFGGLFGRYAALTVAAFQSSGLLDLNGLALGAAAVPVFFLLSVRGMYTSEMLGSMLDRSSASARAEYNREFIPMTAAALAVLAASYFIDRMRF